MFDVTKYSVSQVCHGRSWRATALFLTNERRRNTFWLATHLQAINQTSDVKVYWRWITVKSPASPGKTVSNVGLLVNLATHSPQKQLVLRFIPNKRHFSHGLGSIPVGIAGFWEFENKHLTVGFMWFFGSVSTRYFLQLISGKSFVERS